MKKRDLVPTATFAATVALLATLLLSSWWAQRTLGNGFLPHGYCIQWIPSLLWLHVASDTLIALSYLSIPVTLLVFARRRADLPLRGMFLLFCLFIVACGCTHALGVWTLWHADYWLEGGTKAITAAASVSTAGALMWALPRALAIPSTAELQRAKDALEREVVARRAAEAEQHRAQEHLEQRVAERTAALDEAKALLDAMFLATPLGLAVFDAQCRFVRVNEALARINGVAIADHIGRTPAEVIPDIAVWVERTAQTVLQSRQPLLGLEQSGTTPASPQTAYWRSSYYPVPLADGRMLVGAVCEDISDKRAAEAERFRLLREAELANRLKDEFMARVSHELRTPLQAMLSWVMLLKTRQLDAATAGKALERIEHNVSLQARMISDLLDVSRILSGKLGLELAPIDPGSVVSRTVDSLAPQAEEKGVQLVIDIVPGDEVLITDAQRLEQVVSNLVGNALKFTQAGGHVTVSAGWSDGGWRLQVKDDGVGIDASDLPVLFHPFRQAGSGAEMQHQGLGLGLAIVRSIVQLLGGQVRADSAGAGHGATFTVQFARGLDVQPRTQSRPGPAAPAPQLAGLRVLLVEDEQDVAQALASGLRLLGAEVECLADYTQAQQRVTEVVSQGDGPCRWNVVVSDLRLSNGPGGIAVLHLLHRHWPALPALALSAYGSEADRLTSLQAGFGRHLTKPLDTPSLGRAILDVLKRAPG